MFYNYSNIDTPNLLFYGLIIFLGIYGYTSLMDNSKTSLLAETLFCGLGIRIQNTLIGVIHDFIVFLRSDKIYIVNRIWTTYFLR